MITKQAKQRLKILQFWRKHGLKATRDAFGAKRSTLYGWWKIYVESKIRISISIIEKYNRTIQEEFIDWNKILLLEYINQFNKKLMDWLVWYNTKRYHWSLNLTSPVDYLIKNNMVSKMMWTNTPI